MSVFSPITRRRWLHFRRNRRGWWSLWIFLALFTACLGGELLANDKPLLVAYKGQWYFPAFARYTEQDFDGTLPFQPDYRDPYVRELIEQSGWLLFAPIPFSDDTVNYDLTAPSPTPP
ncbi:MAG: ABC transporter permease, partial [Pseudomonas sp.]